MYARILKNGGFLYYGIQENSLVLTDKPTTYASLGEDWSDFVVGGKQISVRGGELAVKEKSDRPAKFSVQDGRLCVKFERKIYYADGISLMTIKTQAVFSMCDQNLYSILPKRSKYSFLSMIILLSAIVVICVVVLFCRNAYLYHKKMCEKEGVCNMPYKDVMVGASKEDFFIR